MTFHVDPEALGLSFVLLLRQAKLRAIVMPGARIVIFDFVGFLLKLEMKLHLEPCN